MGIKRHRPEEIVTKLRQVEVFVGQGLARIDAIRLQARDALHQLGCGLYRRLLLTLSGHRTTCKTGFCNTKW
jgi:hypothetical protein